MGSLATFKTTYIASTVLPIGARAQLSGPVKAIELQVERGAAYATAVTTISTTRTRRVVNKAQRDSTPNQGSLISDFYAIDAA